MIGAEPELTAKANLPRTNALDPDADDGPDTIEKYVAMFNRRVAKGQCFQQPYLGLREFVAHFEPPTEADRPDAIDPVLRSEEYPLGRMFYDFDYRNDDTRVPLFAPAVLRRGVLDVNEMRESATAETLQGRH